MDAIVFILVGVYFTIQVKNEINVIQSIDLEVRMNPKFYRDEQAFMKYYNVLMRGDK